MTKPQRSSREILGSVTYLGHQQIGMQGIIGYRVRGEVTEATGEYCESAELYRVQGNNEELVDLMYVISGSAENTTVYEAYDWSPPNGTFKYKMKGWFVEYTAMEAESDPITGGG